MNDTHHGEPLSSVGQARRTRMLAELHGAMATHQRGRRRRRAAAAGGSVAAMLLIVVAAVATRPHAPVPRPMETVRGPAAPREGAPALIGPARVVTTAQTAPKFTVVETATDSPAFRTAGTESGIAARLSAAPAKLVAGVDDRQFSKVLAAAGDKRALARIGDRAVLLSR